MTADVVDIADLVAPEPAIGPAEAERVELTSTLTDLAEQVALYSRARDVLLARLAKIQAEEVYPVEQVLRELGDKAATARSRLAMIDYQALGTSDPLRHQRFSEIQAAATRARDAAMNSPAAPRGTIQAIFDREIAKWTASAQRMTMPWPEYSATQRAADHLELFRGLKIEMDRIASMPIDKKMQLEAQVGLARQNGAPLPI